MTRNRKLPEKNSPALPKELLQIQSRALSEEVDAALAATRKCPFTDGRDGFNMESLPKIRNMVNLNGWMCLHCKLVQDNMSFAAFVMHETRCALKMKQAREAGHGRGRGGKGGRGGRGRRGH